MIDEPTVKGSKIYKERFLKDLLESYKESVEGETISLEELEEKVS